MARYSQKFKERVVARLLPPESSPVEAVSQMVGISATTLERWRAECLAKPSGDEVRHWTAAARLEAVIATAVMNEVARSAWCREHGVYPTELETWKQDAIGGRGEPRETESVALKQERRRNKELERELHRKDKALAETAALLVLSKKLAAIFHGGEDARPARKPASPRLTKSPSPAPAVPGRRPPVFWRESTRAPFNAGGRTTVCHAAPADWTRSGQRRRTL